MQNAAFHSKKLNWIYLAFRVTRQKLAAALTGLQSLDVAGLNITIPLKVPVVSLLDRLDKSAAECGAVNTVARRDTEWIGYNTDVDGVLYAFKKSKATIGGSKALVLGAGGAARAVILALNRLGCREIAVANRTKQRTRQLCHEFGQRLGIAISPIPFSRSSIAEATSGVEVVVNATPLGFTGSPAEDLVGADALTSNHVVFDVVYDPIRTRLLQNAESKHALSIPGYNMLVGQGGHSFKIWTGLDAPFDVMEAAVLKELKG